MKDLLVRVMAGESLSSEELEELFEAIMRGELPEAVTSAFLVALRMKGETGAEVAAAARVMRRHAVQVPVPDPDGTVDTCGTGGDRSGTVNISTAAALVAAAGGAPVAKHGNRSVSSRCGSADVLEACGVRLSLSPEALGRLVEEVGIAFLFAPRLHPAMREVMPVRRALGVRTVFNMLGPLTNPAGVRRQVVGVWEPGLVRLLGEALADLGARHALVVHGEEGLDELSVCGPSVVAEVRDGEVTGRWTVTPEDVGLRRGTLDALRGGDAEENARRLRSILEGKERGAAADAVALNAGAALWVGGLVGSLAEGVARAAEVLDSGKGLGVLERLAVRSQELADHG